MQISGKKDYIDVIDGEKIIRIPGEFNIGRDIFYVSRKSKWYWLKGVTVDNIDTKSGECRTVKATRQEKKELMKKITKFMKDVSIFKVAFTD